MKKVIQTIFVTLSLLVVISFTTVNTSEGAVASSSQISEFNNCDITVVRTVENGIRYINVYVNGGILVMKIEEL